LRRLRKENNLIPMSKPARIPTRPDADQNDPPVSQEELDIIRERLKMFEQDRKAARPWAEVKARILSRKPTP
jgi:hypothetical protein